MADSPAKGILSQESGRRTDPRRNFITVLLLRHSAGLSIATGLVRRFSAGNGVGRVALNVVSFSSGT
jgi:hypothetical protein